MRQSVALIVAIITNALANIFVKLGAASLASKKTFELLTCYVKNIYIWLGLLCFGVAFVSYSIVLTKAKLSVAYPVMTSAGFVIVSVVSSVLFKEHFSLSKIVGIAIIAIGIWIVSVL
ncbi:MAG: SMR family transporter [Pseudothermotoga sp.]